MKLSDDDKKELKGCFGVLVNLIFQPLLIVWRAWITTKGWSWFVVPLFGVPKLTIPFAIGVWCVAVLLTLSTPMSRTNESPVRWVVQTITQALWPAMTLLEMWIIKRYFL